MTLKTVYVPAIAREFKFGRRPMGIPRPHLRFRTYLKGNLPAPPALCDYNVGGGAVMKDVMQNDVLGDCGIAGGYHFVGAVTGNAGDLFHASPADIIADYSAIGGYKPGDAHTDQGIVLQDALNYWTVKGFRNGTRLMGWLSVNAANQTELMQALFLSEGLYIGMGLPDAWIEPFPSKDGAVWTVSGASDPNNGHCVYADGYDETGVWIITWGLRVKLTWKALAAYATSASGGECYVLFSPDELGKGQSRAPNGVDWVALVNDFNAMGAHIPVPSPVTPPAPPAAPVTRASVEGWLDAGFDAGFSVQTRSSAKRVVSQTLAKYWPK